MLAGTVLVEAALAEAALVDTFVLADEAAVERLESTGFSTWGVEALDEIGLISMALSLRSGRCSSIRLSADALPT